MAAPVRCFLMVAVVLAPLLAGAAGGKLSTRFYDSKCPNLQSIVRSATAQAVAAEPRMGASILRLFFHDCFVNGCDASILLDDTASFTGEKNAGPNANSVRGYEVIDAIKAQVEASCSGIVSCADIVALAARDSVNLVKRTLGQFTPAQWDKDEWYPLLGPWRFIQVLSLCVIFMTIELNTFFLKFCLWIPPQNPLIVYRLVLWWLIAIPTIREYNTYLQDRKPVKKVGSFCWLSLAICIIELLICIKFGHGLFPKSMPSWLIVFWTTLGGPTWTVQLGRRDALNASQSAANSNLPGPGSSLATLITMFGNKGLSPRDMTALSGAHTVRQARCTTFRDRIYNDANINASFAALRQQTCPQSSGGDGALAPIDAATPDKFDNYYYQNLMSKQDLFHSDQELFNGGSQDALVKKYRGNAGMFAADFAKAMGRMGSLMPSADTPTEIRLDCKKVN